MRLRDERVNVRKVLLSRLHGKMREKFNISLWALDRRIGQIANGKLERRGKLQKVIQHLFVHRRIAAMAADEPREAVTQLYGYAVFLLARTGAAPPAGLEQARQDNAEAMFSGHDIPAEKAAAMQRFVQEVLQACRKKRNPLQRFADRWFHIWY